MIEFTRQERELEPRGCRLPAASAYYVRKSTTRLQFKLLV